jgi:hypothetical protein
MYRFKKSGNYSGFSCAVCLGECAENGWRQALGMIVLLARPSRLLDA